MIGFYAAGAMGQSGGSGSGVLASILSRSPLAYWTQGEPSGTTMEDSSGNGRAGGYIGVSTALAQPGLVAPGTSVRYNPPHSRAEVAAASWMDVSLITVLCIANFQADGSFQHVINRDSNGTTGWWLRRNSDGKLEFSAIVTGRAAAVSASAVSNDTTYLIGGRFDGATLDVLIGDAVVGSVPSVGSLTTVPGESIVLGDNYTASLPFNGFLQHVAIFGYPLSDADFTAIRIEAGL